MKRLFKLWREPISNTELRNQEAPRDGGDLVGGLYKRGETGKIANKVKPNRITIILNKLRT